MGGLAKAATRGGEEDDAHEDKVNAITGVKIEAQIPVIQDWNTDLARHLAEFQNVLDCARRLDTARCEIGTD